MATFTSIFIIIVWLLVPALLSAQDSTTGSKFPFPARFLKKVDKKAVMLNSRVVSKSRSTLKGLARKEKRLLKKLSRTDANLVQLITHDKKTTFLHPLKNYQEETLEISPHNKKYIPYLDSLESSIRFLQQGLLTENDLATKALDHLNNLQNRLHHADQIQSGLQNRQQYLMNQLSRTGLVRQLRKYSKQIWYYRAQLDAFKSLLSNPQNMERKVMDILKQSKPFLEFMNKHSVLASLFGYRQNAAGSTAPAPVPGLQTRVQVSNYLQQSVGVTSISAMQQVHQRSLQMQRQLTAIAEKLSSGTYSNTGKGNVMPNFKVNHQRTKSFWQRCELGIDLQSKRGSDWFPATTDLAITTAYKLNDQSIAGMGIAAAIGWGKSIRHITISYEGMGARSFLDWKLKGSVWISGSYELNYRASFSRMEQLKDLQAWQPSALIGLSKKFSTGKKIRGDIRLLWDFLSYRQIPQTQAFVFRVGYSLN